MPDFPSLYGDTTKTATFGQTTGTLGTQVVAASAPYVKGDWTTIIPATSTFDAQGLLVGVLQWGAGKGLLDIGVGTPPKTILANLLIQSYQAPTVCITCQLPLGVPAGQAVSARYQSTAFYSVYMTATAISQGFLPPSALGAAQTLGTVTTYEPPTPSLSNDGTVVDPGATANTKGAAATLGTLTRNCSSLMIAIGRRGAYCATARWFLDILADGVVVLPDLTLVANATASMLAQVIIGPLPLSLRAGTVLTAKAQCTSLLAGMRELEVAVYAFG
jgi:hypothetical protein